MSSMRLLAICAIFGLAAAARAATLDGSWEMTIMRFGEPTYQRATIETSGEKLTGKAGDFTIEGTAHGDTMAMSAHFKDGKLFGEFTGTMVEGVLIGTAKLFDGQ